MKGSQLDLLTGLDQPVAVRLYGQNPDILREQANRVQSLLAGVEGVVDPRVITTTMEPTVEIEVDLAKAQDAGISPGDVRRAEATLLQGIQVGSVFEEQKVFDVIVQGVPATRSSVDNVRNLLIDLPKGGQIRLGQVADVRVVDRPAVIQRDAVSRRVDVVAGVDGRSVNAVIADIEQQVRGLDFPLEYHAEVLQAEHCGRDRHRSHDRGRHCRCARGVPAVPGGVRQLAAGPDPDGGPATGPVRRVWSPDCSPDESSPWARCSVCWPSSAWPPVSGFP